MNFLKTIFGIGPDPREVLIPLYNSIVGEARDPAWYAEMGVPDTLDGRFDMVAAVLSLVLVRFESEGAAGREPGARLTEVFIDDMDGQLRQLGIGDVVVGKHIGNMIAAIGGRLTAYREAIGRGAALEEALIRNLWRGEPGPDARPALVAERMRAIKARLDMTGWEDLRANGIAAKGIAG
ncbi:ubiquinol-cytochrome C chaperone family protein [Sphingomonas sp. SRS2]|uniref:ubiquinol-cytochrome C chaperone family protein n=1 Tax=Sphingomonas sp. SRS2 TaxID=133190 RepID=UPI00061846B6|nr:ubiquinol-cytochrome C chaperone family protein [Sphingomonas sp. SRS2]KKC24201.1 ubiquinol-cytochrome C chaperone [Sphingomonas sp. SRS2]